MNPESSTAENPEVVHDAVAMCDAPLPDVIQALEDSGLTLAVAESCTGGMLGSHLTEKPGASAYFLGGVVAYADAVKETTLSVPGPLLARAGAVSVDTALAMAKGVRERLGAGLGLSITGISGPTGATEDKPVGTTYIALAAADAQIVRHHEFAGDRAENRASSVRAALALLCDYLGDLHRDR